MNHSLICISIKDNYYNGCSITVGNRYSFSEKYEGEEQWYDKTKKCVYIMDDNLRPREYPKTCFEEITEHRDRKINEIVE